MGVIRWYIFCGVVGATIGGVVAAQTPVKAPPRKATSISSPSDNWPTAYLIAAGKGDDGDGHVLRVDNRGYVYAVCVPEAPK